MRTIAHALAILVVLTLIPLSARAQLVPERVYYGKGRPVPMVVHAPEPAPARSPDPAADAEPAPLEEPRPIEVHLLEAVTARPLARASVTPGRIDLAALFPDLWLAPSPRVQYAQLVVAGRKLGPAVVLQPLLSPVAASLDTRNPQMPRVVFPPPEKRENIFSGLRAYVDQDVLLMTDKGEMRFRLRPDAAPNTCWIFRELVAGGMYTDVPFHRVIALDGAGKPFIVQTGDPLGTGAGGPGFHFNLEPSTLPHGFGVAAMARDPKNPNANGSQFFIGLSREGTRALDGAYAAFAQLISGADALVSIARTPVAGPEGRPLRAPRLLTAKLVDAAPYGEGPRPVESPDREKVER